MAYTVEQLNQIYDRTSGYCHLCGKKVYFKNYGNISRRGAWEVEHSKPQAKGGTQHLNNLYAACISCNRSKGIKPNSVIRKKNGITRAPLSKQNRVIAKQENATAGAFCGALIGSLLLGPWGLAVGAAIGANEGYKRNPDK